MFSWSSNSFTKHELTCCSYYLNIPYETIVIVFLRQAAKHRHLTITSLGDFKFTKTTFSYFSIVRDV